MIADSSCTTGRYTVCGWGGSCCEVGPQNNYVCTTYDNNQYVISWISNTTQPNQQCTYGSVQLCTGGQCAAACMMFVAPAQ